MNKTATPYTLGFQEIDKTKLALVGGKGANLGELSRIEGIKVPQGFCVTTEAYKSATAQTPEFNALLDQLTLLTLDDVERVREGGRMTHGAVIAREYGLPAVVGVENATKLTTDGQRIRVNGTEGYVEINV